MIALIFGLLVLVALIAPIWGIFDAAQRPDDEWQAARQNKIVWVLLQVFLWSLGTFIYAASIRPQLRSAEAASREALIDGLAVGEVSYELGEWTTPQLAEISVRLRSANLPHRWDGGRLIVKQGDDGLVDRFLDEIEGEEPS